MAVSLGSFSIFSTAGETASFVKSASSYSVKLAFPLAAHHANLRTVRMVTFATASKPVATEPKKREPRGIMKPRRVSPEMQAFLGGIAEIPRTQALKLIWAHIKENNLQVYPIFASLICYYDAIGDLLFHSVLFSWFIFCYTCLYVCVV